MYTSLKSWINLDMQIKPFIKRTGTGTKVFGDTVDVKCYAASKIVTVTDSTGVEVISSTQLYVNGDTPVDIRDRVIFEARERDILNISTFYRDGKADIKVVYLR